MPRSYMYFTRPVLTVELHSIQCLAIIESIRDGSTVRACLTLPNGEYQYITLMISGIRAPIIRQGVSGTEDLVEPFAEEVRIKS